MLSILSPPQPAPPVPSEHPLLLKALEFPRRIPPTSLPSPPPGLVKVCPAHPWGWELPAVAAGYLLQQ